MTFRGRSRRLASRIALTSVIVLSSLTITPSPVSAKPHGVGSVPAAPGLAPVSAPHAATPQRLPKKAGSVPLRRGVTARGRVAAAGTDQVAVRALVIAVDSDDFGLPTWRAALDRVGAAYDVLFSRTTPLTADSLLRADGVGRYNAILLTDSLQLYREGGAFLQALDTDEWNLLWAYERDYAVRQATLYTSYGTWPEDYCLRPVSEGGVGDTPLTTSLTSTGAQIFDYLRATAQVPITESYVYRTQLADGCGGEAVLTAGGDVLGVRSTSTDGRERLALSFTSNQYLLQADLLTYGLLRWASRGLFFGEQRHHLNIDVDDWFNTADHLFPDGHLETDPGFELTAHDAYNLDQQQLALRAAHPLAGDFTLGLAYNGGDADLAAGNACSPDGGVDEFTATTRCLAGDFRWVNHTVSHPELNFTDYATNVAEIQGNLNIASTLGLPVATTVVKTGEYSGLGVYNDDPDNDIDPPTDHGLAASNPQLLAAARDLGVTYLHGNMSFPSHVPSCFSCAIVHPLEPAVSVVPDWPTNVAYHTTTPEEETYFYNSFYGPNGRFPFWPQDLTYAQLMDYETDVALHHVAAGSVYTHTFHISNVRDYQAGRTLLTDWLELVLSKYSGYYSVPVLNEGWPGLADYASARTRHFAALAAGVDAVYDRGANTVTVSSPAAGTVTVSGVQTAGSTVYGSDVSAPIALSAGDPVTFTPSLRP
jgi:hypothetical protein